MDTFNKFAVAGRSDGYLLMMMPPTRPISPDDALMLAAWLVVMAEPHTTHSFVEALQAVKNT